MFVLITVWDRVLCVDLRTWYLVIFVPRAGLEFRASYCLSPSPAGIGHVPPCPVLNSVCSPFTICVLTKVIGQSNADWNLDAVKTFYIGKYSLLAHTCFVSLSLSSPRLKFKLGEDVVLMVGIYNLVQKANKPFPVRLYRETNEPVKTKTRTFNVNTGSLLLPSDTKRSLVGG